MNEILTPLPYGSVRLLPGLFKQRETINRKYMLTLKTENLLQNHYMEAGLWGPRTFPGADIHWGWESPTCQVRGHFLGHWLSAAAFLTANNQDYEIKGKADHIVHELARCQKENGGEWVGSIPEKYLDWVARGKAVWAPQYVLHKTLMGLWDMYAVGDSQEALDILVRWAHWFHRWSGQFTREQMDEILDVETGGMLEVWANLYGLTGESEHRDLLERYNRPRLFEPLLAGKDVLTNRHMNTTVPEVQGAARAWEVTGQDRWRDIVEAYWEQGVNQRGYYATGGQTNGEVWSPPDALSARLGFRTQEHCTVYNMMRLADYLYRWTGDTAYADYWERNLWNGILAQQHPDTGQIAYFLPLHAGAQKAWGSQTEDFWCCHGSLVQVHTRYPNHIAFTYQGGLTLAHFLPCEVAWEWQGSAVQLKLTSDPQLDQPHRPESTAYTLTVRSSEPRSFGLRLRLPWWLSGAAEVTVNGERLEHNCGPSSYLEITQTWTDDTLYLRLPKSLMSVPLPDDPNTLAFMDGPIVLAGLNPSYPGIQPDKNGSSKEYHPNYAVDGITLHGNAEKPRTFLVPDNDREWDYWRGDYRTTGQERNLRFIPLFEVRDEVYSVYFEIQP